ncbi:50S ribosomal protein L4 [Acidihalobacter ferrooxydans]|uniref:Large ribosomal subunit protein uL4 n=1 Tax=Acidihalobacter ferrooxydans TaxID=1765967 RepID=A0A1P8UJW4_9GAMM|nr:50S ribosomal protein L4 [Acidihalobacter ferrooxydans]APZ44084.1 50S ribosomal protein L4 [Acidihalobacter ferrooxydans]
MEFQVQGGNAISLADGLFDRDFNESLVHQAIVAYMAGGRSGTKAQKSRAEVRGGGIKPWRQKGTGRARAGSIRSPIWVGGGRAFAAKPRSYAQKLNKKMYRAAMRSIFSELVRQDRLVAVEAFSLDAPKTKSFLAVLDGVVSERNALIVIDQPDEALWLGARNVPHVEVTDVAGLDPVRLVGYERVVVTVAALKQIEEWLA